LETHPEDWRADPLRAASDSAPVAIAIMDREYRYLYANEALAKVNGVPLEQTIGRTIGEVLPHDAAVIEPLHRRVVQTGEVLHVPVIPAASGVGRPVTHWSGTYYPVFNANHEVVGVAATIFDVTARVERQARDRFLGDAAAALATSLDSKETLDTLAHLAVPFLADMCVVDLAEPDGSIRRVAVAHADPEEDEFAKRLRDYGTPDPRHNHPVLRVIRTGVPVLLSEINPEYVDHVTSEGTHRELAQSLNYRSSLTVPLIARAQILGALSLVITSSDRRYSERDLPLAQEFARRAAVAAYNAQLYERERTAREAAERAERWTSRLQTATAALAAAGTMDEVTETILAECAAALEAPQAIVVRVTEDGNAVTVEADLGFPPGHFAQWPTVDLKGRAPLLAAIRTGEIVWIRSGAEALARFPDIVAMRETGEPGAWVSVPLVYRGVVLGGVGLVLNAERDPTPDEEAFLRALGPLCAQAFERARLFEAERVARADAEGANRAKTDFLAAMSHELRTPLNAIAGYAEILSLGLRGPTTPEQQQDLARITRSQRHLLGVITDILNFARVDAGRVEYQLRDVSVADVLVDVDPLVAPQLASKSLLFTQHVAEPPPVMHADPEKVRQILLNLVSNAIKFTPPGGHVRVSADALLHEVRICVADTGVGIPPDRQAAIFEPFTQVHRTLSQPTEGTGLGLAISRELARGMHGDLTVRSTPGEGSTFILTLPLAKPAG
jgi:PAS domain S-box-containing protein